MNNLQLCYVENHFAYFTTQPVEDQWGDDWNDCPYELNAGRPYTPCWHNEKRSDKRPCNCEACKRSWDLSGDEPEPLWKIEKISYDGPLVTPNEKHIQVSVEEINNGAEPWLDSHGWTSTDIRIFAGETLPEFIEKVNFVDGTVFVPFHSFKDLRLDA